MGIIPLHARGFTTNQTTKTSMLLLSRVRGLVTPSRFYHARPSLKWKCSALWCFHNIKQWWKWSWRKHSCWSPSILPGPVFLIFKPPPTSVRNFLQRSMGESPLILINSAVLLFLGDPTTCTLSRAFWDAKVLSAECLQLADCYFLSFRLTHSIYTTDPTWTSLGDFKLNISPSELIATFPTFLNLLLFLCSHPRNYNHHPSHCLGRNTGVFVDQSEPTRPALLYPIA